MIEREILLKAYHLMCTAKAMSEKYEVNRQICKYVHATSRGHEAIQLATAFQLLPCDYISPYYRDESMLLGLGFTPYQLMLQLLAKENDIFTGGREYYSHPNYRGDGKPTIIHQSSATGMQAIPTTGVAQGIQFLERIKSPLYHNSENGEAPVVICSMGDASLTEGEVSEAFQFAVLKQLPIIYLVQDNDWGISVTAAEARTMDAYRFARGFKGLQRTSVDGSNFSESFRVMKKVITEVRNKRSPWLVHATVPLLGHHTSGVRKEFYRNEQDLAKHALNDPIPRLRKKLLSGGFPEEQITAIENNAAAEVEHQFQQAVNAPEPDPATVSDFVFMPSAVIEEKGERSPAKKEKVLMVDAALFAIREIMEEFPETILYGQDVGRRLGGVFRKQQH